jgi:hypothetical protein
MALLLMNIINEYADFSPLSCQNSVGEVIPSFPFFPLIFISPHFSTLNSTYRTWPDVQKSNNLFHKQKTYLSDLRYAESVGNSSNLLMNATSLGYFSRTPGASLSLEYNISYMWKSGWVTLSPAKNERSPKKLEKASYFPSKPAM